MQVNFQAPLEPCINDAIEVVEKKLYNQPVLNQVLGDTLSFEQSLFGQRNKLSPMHFPYHSRPLVIQKGSFMFVAIILTKLDQGSLAIPLSGTKSDLVMRTDSGTISSSNAQCK
ncbi:hypothetical protein ACB098_02G102600 [Castanea mollissima]